MSSLTVLFVITALLCGFLASLAVWSRRTLCPKLVAFGAALLILPTSYASFAELLSKPKPITLEWWHGQSEEATVVSSVMRENEGIFLWLQLASITEPRSYVLPWNQELAEQLQKAMEEANERQSGVRMRLPFENSLDDREPKFYALPQPALPPKDMFDGPEMYKQPGQAA